MVGWMWWSSLEGVVWVDVMVWVDMVVWLDGCGVVVWVDVM